MNNEQPPAGHPFSNLSPRARVAALLVLLVVFFIIFGRQLLDSASLTGAGNPNQTKAISTPVVYSQDGITLRVEELVAAPDQTRLVYTLSGIPAGETPPIVFLQTLNGYNYISHDYQQSIISAGTAGTSYQVTAGFEALPHVSDVRLVWERHPSAQVVTNDVWVIPLHLLPLK